jgi:transposase InsO family protein
MRAHGIQGAKRRGKPWHTTKPDPDAARRPDPVNRQFTAQEPNRLWVGDLSYRRCWEGIVHFAFIVDVFSRRVIGRQLATHMRTDLVLDALRMAVGTREPGADFRLVAHTDSGSQKSQALRIDASALQLSAGHGTGEPCFLDEHLGRGHERRGMRGYGTPLVRGGEASASFGTAVWRPP